MTPLFYRLFKRLPGHAQALIIYLVAPKLTVGVSAVITDGYGRLFLVHHTYRSPAWGFPSGLVGRDEQPAAALERELCEELALSADVGELLHADHCTQRHHLTLYYRVGIVGTPHHGAETDRHHYASLDELPKMLGITPPAWLRVLCQDAALAPASPLAE